MFFVKKRCKIDFLTLKMVKIDKVTTMSAAATAFATFLPHCPTMSQFLTSISPSFWRYERDIVCVGGAYTFDQLAALPYQTYLGIMPFEDARKLFAAVQATKNGNPCPYGDNSGRMLPVGHTGSNSQLRHEWDWTCDSDYEYDSDMDESDEPNSDEPNSDEQQDKSQSADCPQKMYHIAEQIGEGCSSKVYKATHHQHGQVAVKVIDKQYTIFAQTEASLLKEMQECPNFPRLYDTWVDEKGRFCIAMEHIHSTLEKVLMEESEISLTMGRRYFIVGELAKAILDCHKKGIAHFDIKANNIGLTEDGRVLLFDFGLAERFDTIQEPSFQASVAEEEIVKVSKEHRPPEGFLHNHPLTEKADIWSFAVVVYDIFMVKNLFDVNTFHKSVPTLPANLNKQVPSYIEDLIRRCTQLDPKDRPSTEEWRDA